MWQNPHPLSFPFWFVQTGRGNSPRETSDEETFFVHLVSVVEQKEKAYL